MKLCFNSEHHHVYLGHVHLSSVHELQDGGEVLEGDVLEDDDGVLGGVLLQQVLEVGAAGAEDHLVGLGVLALGGDGHVAEGLLIPQVLEAGDHVGLEIIPAEAELLVVRHLGLVGERLMICNKANSVGRQQVTVKAANF